MHDHGGSGNCLHLDCGQHQCRLRLCQPGVVESQATLEKLGVSASLVLEPGIGPLERLVTDVAG